MVDRRLVQRLVQAAAIGGDQRVVIAQQIEDLHQGLAWQVVAVAAIAAEQLQQAIQCRFVLLAGQLLHGQLVGGLVVAGIASQAALEVGDSGRLAAWRRKVSWARARPGPACVRHP